MAPDTRSQPSLSQVADMDFIKSTLAALQESLDHKFDSLTARIDKLEVSQSSHNLTDNSKIVQDSSSSQSGVAPEELLKGIKLAIPKFSSEDVLGWIFQVEQFFEFHHIDGPQRLSICSFAMTGEALQWYKWMFLNKRLSNWNKFVEDLSARFSPSGYEDVQGMLSKLTQSSSVAQYQSEFEMLSNRIQGLPDSFLISCFISGLKPALRRDVQISRPKSMMDAIWLARMYEDKWNDRNNTFKPSFSAPLSNKHTVSFSKPFSASHVASTSSTVKPTSYPMKRLTAEEMQARRDKGLCYNSDEKYSQNHKCKSKFLLLLHDNSEDTKENMFEHSSYTDLELTDVADAISYHVLSRNLVP